MIYSKKYILIITVFFSQACKQSSVVGFVPVDLVKPDCIVELSPDNSVYQDFPEVLNCLDLQIVQDSLLVIQDQVREGDACHFKVYSLNTYRHLGSLIHYGRGPGEMISPLIVKTNPEERILCLSENTEPLGYKVHVSDSFKNPDLLPERLNLPADKVDWMSVCSNNLWVSTIEGNQYLFHELDSNGDKVTSVKPFPGIDVVQYMTYLSSIITGNSLSGKIALAMVFLPQIIFIDTDFGEISSVAVNKAYLDWDAIFNSDFNMDTKQYYLGITSTFDYIFASYWGDSIGKISEGKCGTSIQIIDWSGHFLREIKVKETLGSLAFDQTSEHLYGVERSSGRIVRYNLSSVMPD